MYTLVDIIDKLIDLERQQIKVYESIAAIPEILANIKIIAKVLQAEGKRHIAVYEKMKKELEQMKEPLMIDFVAYDKVASLFNEFKTRLFVPYPQTPQELLQYTYTMKQENKALVIDIQGRLLAQASEAGVHMERVMTRIIVEEERHLQNLKQFIL